MPDILAYLPLLLGQDQALLNWYSRKNPSENWAFSAGLNSCGNDR